MSDLKEIMIAIKALVGVVMLCSALFHTAAMAKAKEGKADTHFRYATISLLLAIFFNLP